MSKSLKFFAGGGRISSPRTKLLAARCECMHEHFALSSNHNAKQLILIRCKHSQRAARSFVRGLESALTQDFRSVVPLKNGTCCSPNVWGTGAAAPVAPAPLNTRICKKQFLQGISRAFVENIRQPANRKGSYIFVPYTRLARLTPADSRKFCLRLLGCQPGCTIVYYNIQSI